MAHTCRNCSDGGIMIMEPVIDIKPAGPSDTSGDPKISHFLRTVYPGLRFAGFPQFCSYMCAFCSVQRVEECIR